MRISLLTTGAELLLGHTANTHPQWIGQELFTIGLRLERHLTVGDSVAIGEAVQWLVPRSEVLIVTGGLGPTSDDQTREQVAEALGLELIEDKQALCAIENFFALRGRPLIEANRKQALVPPGADVLANAHGTAPGTYIPPRLVAAHPCAVFLLPGPPRELYPMWHAEVAPRLLALGGVDEQRHTSAVLKFTGIGESDFHAGVDAALAAIASLEHGYCARVGELDLRLIGPPEAVAHGAAVAQAAFPKQLFSSAGESLEAVLIKLLAERGLTLACAESCTGGALSHRLTNVPGASAVLTHGWVTYSNSAKIEQLGVEAELIEKHGAVSELVARAMAEGALRRSRAALALAITGIAGPEGGSELKPVGTAWIALAREGEATVAQKVFHPRARKDFKQAISQCALELARQSLLGIAG